MRIEVGEYIMLSEKLVGKGYLPSILVRTARFIPRHLGAAWRVD